MFFLSDCQTLARSTFKEVKVHCKSNTFNRFATGLKLIM